MELKDYILKRFDNPDEVRTFEKGNYEIVRLGDGSFGRATYQLGWRWSTHVKLLAGTESREVDHLGLALSGRVQVRMNDEAELEPISRGHAAADRAPAIWEMSAHSEYPGLTPQLGMRCVTFGPNTLTVRSRVAPLSTSL